VGGGELLTGFLWAQQAPQQFILKCGAMQSQLRPDLGLDACSFIAQEEVTPGCVTNPQDTKKACRTRISGLGGCADLEIAGCVRVGGHVNPRWAARVSQIIPERTVGSAQRQPATWRIKPLIGTVDDV
jgi:hypothetical protein